VGATGEREREREREKVEIRKTQGRKEINSKRREIRKK
jgi:hypothetical protein